MSAPRNQSNPSIRSGGALCAASVAPVAVASVAVVSVVALPVVTVIPAAAAGFGACAPDPSSTFAR